MNTFDELLAYFKSLGIDCSSPGFYDDPSFMRVEAQDPAILDKYARFVDLRPMSQEEADRARRIVPLASDFLFAKLRKDGRLGACIDASLVLSRFLERNSVWNYVVKGALTVTFARSTRLKPNFLGVLTLPENPAVAGHVWVCAPPYLIVDITASRQPYPDNGRRVIGPIYIIVESAEPAAPEGPDLFDPDAVAMFRRERGRTPTMDDVRDQVPDIDAKIAARGAYLVPQKRASFKYIGVATSAPDLPLERMENLRLSGKLPQELYDEFSSIVSEQVGKLDGP